jgi:acyl-CoA reductase-like NAD-dependent aldehyde dehydrogenase
MSTSRHLVHNSIAKEYASALATRAERRPVGDPPTQRSSPPGLVAQSSEDITCLTRV